jgi:serine/threonine protein kinase
VHRDIKPANLIREFKTGKMVLVDFGLARSVAGPKTQTSVGTLGYSPLEQIQGRSEPRSDLYALGVTMHHLLTNQEPVPLDIPPLRKADPRMDEQLARIVDKATAMTVDERFQSAREMRQALQGWLDRPQEQAAEKIPVWEPPETGDLMTVKLPPAAPVAPLPPQPGPAPRAPEPDSTSMAPAMVYGAVLLVAFLWAGSAFMKPPPVAQAEPPRQVEAPKTRTPTPVPTPVALVPAPPPATPTPAPTRSSAPPAPPPPPPPEPVAAAPPPPPPVVETPTPTPTPSATPEYPVIPAKEFPQLSGNVQNLDYHGYALTLQAPVELQEVLRDVRPRELDIQLHYEVDGVTRDVRLLGVRGATDHNFRTRIQSEILDAWPEFENLTGKRFLLKDKDAAGFAAVVPGEFNVHYAIVISQRGDGVDEKTLRPEADKILGSLRLRRPPLPRDLLPRDRQPLDAPR